MFFYDPVVLGNAIDNLSKLRSEINAGRQIGPRVVPAGFIDGPGPYEGPIKVLAATPEEAKVRVDRYSELGYEQIKIYSSINPELVPVIAEEAHRRGLRVSGHVPSGMIAEQFVRAGADEIQHINFIFLNFMPDVKETSSMKSKEISLSLFEAFPPDEQPAAERVRNTPGTGVGRHAGACIGNNP
jgi:hypothetical protein